MLQVWRQMHEGLCMGNVPLALHAQCSAGEGLVKAGSESAWPKASLKTDESRVRKKESTVNKDCLLLLSH